MPHALRVVIRPAALSTPCGMVETSGHPSLGVFGEELLPLPAKKISPEISKSLADADLVYSVQKWLT